MKKLINNRNGVTLVELLITLVIFSIIIVTMHSVYTSFLRIATTERKTAKTEIDLINVVWPMIKEVQSAGLGTPDDPLFTCSDAIALTGGVLTIHSTAAGDAPNAGSWSYIEPDCSVSNIPDGSKVVVISALNRSRVGSETITAGKVGAACDPDNANNLAFWYEDIMGGIECYETKYSLQPYGIPPKMCAPGTSQFSRSVSSIAGIENYVSMFDCVHTVDLRFGCIDTSGDISWQTDTNCATGDLHLVRIGLIVQSSSFRNMQSPASIDLFGSIGAATTVNITPAQRNYKWRAIEQTIALRNIF